MNAADFSKKIEDAKPPAEPTGWWSGLCPTGKHENPSRTEFGWRDGDVAVVVKCQKGCARADILKVLGLTKDDLRLRSLTVEQVAQAKGFTGAYLTGLGVKQAGSSVLVTYKTAGGANAPRSQLRHAGTPKFTWTPGKGGVLPYGLWKLGMAREQGRLFLVEGASDCWAGWLHGVPTLGVPGATNAGCLEAEHLTGVESLYVVKEPDEAGAVFVAGVADRLKEIGWEGDARVVEMPDGLKDLCELHQRYGQLPPEDLSFNADVDEAVYVSAELELPAEPAPAQPARSAVYDHTPLGLSKKLIDGYGRDLMFVHGLGWLVWDGKRWKTDAGEYLVMRRCKRTVDVDIRAEAAQMMQDARDLMAAVRVVQAVGEAAEGTGKLDDTAESAERQAAALLTARAAVLDKWRKKCSGRARLTEMYDLAKDDERVLRDVGELDQKHWLFVVRNGTVDLTTGKLRASDRGDLITQLSPAVYDAAAKCPRFERFMLEIMVGDAELVSFMQRLLGYCLTGSTEERKFAIFHGLGANGKSTLLEVLRKLMGPDYARQTPPHTLMLKRDQGGASPELARLRGARLVTSVENEKGGRLAEGIVKSLTGNDTVVTRKLYEDYFEFTSTHKIVLATNHEPVIAGTGDAIWDRILKVPFDARFTGDADDKKLKDELAAELPGVLNWLVEGCLEYRRVGLGVPAKVLEANAEYRKKEDTLSEFFESLEDLRPPIVEDPRAVISCADFYDRYRLWARMNSPEALTKKALGTAMKERRFEAPEKAVRLPRYGMKPMKVYRGIGYLPDGVVTDVTDVTVISETSKIIIGSGGGGGDISEASENEVTSVTPVTKPGPNARTGPRPVRAPRR